VGVRDVDGKSCKDLGELTAVWLAVLLSSGEPLNEHALEGREANEAPNRTDVQSDGEQSEQDGGPSTSAAPAPAPPVPTPPSRESHPKPSPEAPPARRTHPLLELPFGALSIGPMQHRSDGLGLAAGLSFERWRFLAEGTLWSTQQATTTYLLNQYTANLKRFSAGARGCRAMWGSALELASCLTVSVQHLSASATGLDLASQTPSTTWLAAGAGVQARGFIAPWLGLVVGIDGEFETARPEIYLRGIGGVERLSPAAATITVGSEWIF
jgi:hypothetical protein